MGLSPRSDVEKLLKDVGFKVRYYKSSREYCFNIVAKRGEETLLVKCISTLTSFTSSIASELRDIAHKTQSTPLIVTNDRSLEGGVVYKRYRINAVTYGTLREALTKGRYPLIYAERGGFYVTIDGKKLRKMRIAKGLSLGELADNIGVSRKAIYEYERGCMASTPEVAFKLEVVLGEELAKPINFLKWKPEPVKATYKRNLSGRSLVDKIAFALKKWGFSVSLFKRSPFEAAALNKDKNKLILKEVKWGNDLELKEVELSSDFARKVEAKFIVLAKDNRLKYEIEEVGVDALILNGRKVEEVKHKGINALS